MAASSHATIRTKSLSPFKFRNGRSSSIEPPDTGTGISFIPAARLKDTGGSSMMRQPLASISMACQVDVYALVDLSNAEMDPALLPIEVSLGLDDSQRGLSCIRIRGAVGVRVVSPIQPALEALAADGPGFFMPVDFNLRVAGAVGGVE